MVGHSLGNILIRRASQFGLPQGAGRVVMLAPPNRAAELALELKPWPLFRWLFGDTGQRLADPEFYAQLPAPTPEFAVIAGTKGVAAAERGPNDSVVLVENTKLAGMKAFRAVEAGHTFIMNKKEVFVLAEHFLRTGAFPAP